MNDRVVEVFQANSIRVLKVEAVVATSAEHIYFPLRIVSRVSQINTKWHGNVYRIDPELFT